MQIKEIYKLTNEKKVSVSGWVLSVRGNKNILFITINDGSTFQNLQLVASKIKKFNDLSKLRTGAAISVIGNIKFTPNAQQPLELVISDVNKIVNVTEDYPLVKGKISLETLRELPHLRHKTNFFRAITRIRSTVSHAIHEYFKKENYTYISAPIITSNDGEGAGDSFYINDNSKKHFFGKKVSLGVTGQLHAEALAMGMKKVYTFAPTFRAEKSHTKRHIAEFWMIEPEVAFYNLEKIINVSYELIQYLINEVLNNNLLEINFLSKINNVDLKQRLNMILKSKVKKCEYKEAIKILNNAIKNNKKLFQNNNIFFGDDLATEHEKYLAGTYFKQPVVIYNYPKKIKAFYMYQNKDNKTVAAFDLLFPIVGEIVGGSQRENNYNKLIKRMKELNMNVDEYKWYVDLRKYGYPSSSGFGLGLERIIMYITGTDNIRDVISFPRSPNSIIA